MASRGGRAFAAALLFCAAGLLVACEPPVNGFMGLTVDAAGRPVAVMQICEHVDGVTIYSETPSVDPDQSPIVSPVATWVVSPSASGFVQVPLSGSGWQLQGERRPLRADTEYSLHAWSNTGSPRAGYATFTLAGLKKLQFGQVHVGKGLEADPGDRADGGLTIPLAEFRTGPCT
ncbi:hypothetical protein AB0I34_43405 [Kribbella sp. NPDC050281]|uniref:hypothetical protein n=1 Tax=Kribbella sp. NPDC050281 TaxID=3155515 RepID=UPI0034102729